MAAENGNESSPAGSPSGTTHASPSSCSHCPHPELIQSLNRQSAAMERLAELLPQLIAHNQMLIELMGEDDEPADTYLDGTAR